MARSAFGAAIIFLVWLVVIFLIASHGYSKT